MISSILRCVTIASFGFQTAQHERVTFLGNVTLGKDVGLEELRRMYDAVILAYGASEDRPLNIQGEDFQNVISARYFKSVNGYELIC